ncbi:maleylpyruvate isomerase family mycothiol-dependent enzyme [Rhodococcus fascians]|nr:maleylpyruvate isomerase family mycothiol-dependent enzyme [Rhodococcus fascians]MBY3998406.1 maleylpyruvate isomerase family mycothiol-dependent enzyme [Rhodococcus fascians]MBY4004599.1 maleylpyruvate isomerase family mycothiol-dependent enzyme [Rhodococcus fascians]MBY4009219.1 maleylpyruvate isomerase family mycothiol-dependent enzyme [Rhodococcus fascians]MBY4019806.1 maleylpyruvate isomerase family mycothiol-dependent enzyme [Rhodococcus fascians]
MSSDLDDDAIFAEISDERRSLARTFDTFTPEQWDTPSLCAACTVRDVAAHLVVPLIVPLWQFGLAMVRTRGNFDRANQMMTQRTKRKHGDELPALLTAHADKKFTPPGHGPLAPLSDVIVHGLDVCRPLGTEHHVPEHRMTTMLDFLVPESGAAPFKGPELRLQWRATDMDWSRGEGPVVEGSAGTLALVLTGRSIALADITGPGAAQLAEARANRRRS